MNRTYLRYSELFKIATKYLIFEARSIRYIIAYTILIGILSVSASILIQFVVNEMAFTGQFYPLIMLSGILVGILIFNTIAQLIRKILIELIQQRILVRISFGVTEALTHQNLEPYIFIRNNLIHRFFDTFSYQKYMTVLLMDGVGIIIFTFVGSLIILFYHPMLFLLNIFIIFLVAMVIHYFLQDALSTNFDQSTKKYELSEWFAQLADNRSFFWNKKHQFFAFNITDQKITSYLHARRKHFNVILWQHAWLYGLQTLGAFLFLIIGGYLVLSGQMQLGQLVASESILIALMYNIAQFSYTLDASYDMITASQKLDYLLDAHQNYQEKENLIQTIDFLNGINISIQSNNNNQLATFMNGQIIFICQTNPLIRQDFAFELLKMTNNSREKFNFKINDIPLSQIDQKFIKQNILYIDRSYLFNETMHDNLFLFPHIGSKENLIKDIEKIFNLSQLNLKDLIDQYKLILLRCLFSPCPIIIIENIFESLPIKNQIQIVKLFNLHLKDKIIFILVSSLQEYKNIFDSTEFKNHPSIIYWNL